jgi:septum formation protein
MRVVLASASPARRHILESAGISPDVIVSGVAEDDVTGPPAALAGELASRKANAVASRLNDEALVIGCDSVLDFEGVAFGKPTNAEEARQRWRQLRGRSGVLVTGHHLVRTDNHAEASGVAATTVWFGEPSDAEIDAYVATEEPLHVAGAFTIDGLGGWFIDRLDGDHTNVVGISLPLVRRLVVDLGLSITALWRPAWSQTPAEHAGSVDFGEATQGDRVQETGETPCARS